MERSGIVTTSGINKFRQAQEGRLLGALLRVPFLTIVERVYQELMEAGFQDVTYAHLNVFRHIDARTGSRLVDLAEEAQITKQSMGYLIDQLERQGYVERVPDQRDGRARRVCLTPRGMEIMAVARQVVSAVEEEWSLILGQERLDELRTTLRDLVAMLEETKYHERMNR